MARLERMRQTLQAWTPSNTKLPPMRPAAAVLARPRGASIQIDSLTRVAEVRGSDFADALVPRQDLETTLDKRALELEGEALKIAHATMELNRQGFRRVVDAP